MDKLKLWNGESMWIKIELNCGVVIYMKITVIDMIHCGKVNKIG